MQFVIKYKKIMALGATVFIAVVLAFFPIVESYSGRLVTVDPDLILTPAWLIPNKEDPSADSKNEYISAVDTSNLKLIWSGALPLSTQSDETITNVILAANAIDAVIINKSDVFSFNDVVGVRTQEKGYQEGLMYSEGSVVYGIGGGICIMSTLLYNAVLETGLNIIERHPHSGPVSYAVPGRDAAVAYGAKDFRFQNNTNSMIVIKTKVENNELILALFGEIPLGQTVDIESKDLEVIPFETEQIEDASIPEGQEVIEQEGRPGYKVTIVRTIRQGDKVVKRETISRDSIEPQKHIVRIPLIQVSIPTNIEPLPEFPSGLMKMEPPTSILEIPKKTDAPTPKVPRSDKPVTGTIKVPDDIDNDSQKDHDVKSEPLPSVTPLPKPPLSEPVSPGSEPAADPSLDERSLSNKDLTIPEASE